MVSEGDALELIISVIRGDRPLETLRECGINVTIEDAQEGPRIFSIDNPRKLVAVPEPVDVARGLLNYWPDRKALFDWAAYVYVAGGDFIDYTKIEQLENGQILFDAMWDASFGNPIQAPALDLARQLLSAQVD